MRIRPPNKCGEMVLALLLLLVLGRSDSWAQEPEGDAAIRRLAAQTYAQPNGQPLLADIYLPPGEGPFPAVLLIHGGAWRTGSRISMALHAMALAEAGYVAISIDYRLAPAHPYPAQLEDCRAAWAWVHQHADQWQLDPARLAVYGYSAGAHLACLMGLQHDVGEAVVPRPRAVVAGGAPCDFEWIPANSTVLEYFLGGTRREKPEAYRDASPLAHVSNDDPPVYLFHGENDKLVPLSSPQRLQRRLSEVGVDCVLKITPGSGHVWTFMDPQASKQAIQFLDGVLKKNERRVADDKDRGAAEASSEGR